MASLIRSIVRLFVAMRPPTRLPAIADDILQEIFLRIGSFADLACASSACSTFRRIIADRAFLRRYRALHPPLLLGFVYSAPADFQRAEAPHPNSAAAHVLSCAAGFSFDYLPAGLWNRWDPCDVRDGRVLLKSSPERYKGVVLAELAVCDPVFQRYLLLPPIADELLASVEIEDQDLLWFLPRLVPSGEEDDETSFKVIGWTYCNTKIVVFVFSRCSGSWIVGASICWDALNLNMPDYYDQTCHYAYGCFFGRVGREGNRLLKLDMSRMEFSVVDLPLHLPPELFDPRIVLAEAGEGRLLMFSQICGGASLDYTTLQNESEEGANVCGTVPLPSNYKCSIKCAAGGYIFLVGTRKGRGALRAVCFSLEIRTLKIERNQVAAFHLHTTHRFYGAMPLAES
ncbi:hypothetical protein PR202_gb21173 [Eleusine coracana subsp. coracana]|uniref:F-box domain-containing protein n=1 Tax=Eleusine coracana subsp. coracana TaxID=191504 RepID=A0AAV5FAH5_ELECO|nr:hypothetical protein PR202_gb21173 [Eleusine coracana subsp. coracana]